VAGRERCILVTGVSRYLSGRFAQLLTAQAEVDRVIGVDVVPPPHDIGGAEFVRADIRNPVIGKIIGQSEVDTVVNMNVIATPLSAGGRTSQ
jgi:UDP-glucose 4-epimerase